MNPIAVLDDSHLVEKFASGDLAIDTFLHQRARIEQAQRLSQVYVTANGDHVVEGYFTLSPISIPIKMEVWQTLDIGETPFYRSIGGTLLGQLGVATNLQGQGIGEALVARAAQISKYAATIVGGVLLAVDPKDNANPERLKRWYAKLGFVAPDPRKNRMILSLNKVP